MRHIGFTLIRKKRIEGLNNSNVNTTDQRDATDKREGGHTGRSSRIDQTSGQTLGSTEKARETKQREARAMQKGKYWKLHQRRCNQPYTGIHKQLLQRARGRQMKRTRWKNGGAAMGGLLRDSFVTFPVSSSYHCISPFLRGLSL